MSDVNGIEDINDELRGFLINISRERDRLKYYSIKKQKLAMDYSSGYNAGMVAAFDRFIFTMERLLIKQEKIELREKMEKETKSRWVIDAETREWL